MFSRPAYEVARERGEDAVDFRDRDRLGLARQRAPLHLQRRTVGIAAQLAAAADERRVQRSGADERMRRLRLQRAGERLEPCEDPAAAPDRGLPLLRPAAPG